MRSSLLAAFLAPTLALVACSYSKDVAVRANGSENQLYFSQTLSADLGAVPIGVSRTITVARNSGGSVECRGLGTGSTEHGSLAAQGGGIPTIPPDTCATVPNEKATVESATCDDDACTLSTEDKGDHVVVRLAAKHPGAVATRLRIALKGTDGTVWRDSIALRFAPAARIALYGTARNLAPMRLPVLEGIEFLRPYGTVVDDDGKPMSTDADTMVAHPVTGGVLETAKDGPYEGSLVARRPGKATLRWELPGAITRDVEVEVVARTEATGIELHASPAKEPTPSPDFDELTLEKITPGPALTEVNVDSGKAARFSTRVRLVDGRLALAPIDSVAVDPSTALVPSTEAIEAWSFELRDRSARDAGAEVRAGTVTVGTAGLTLALPFQLAPR